MPAACWARAGLWLASGLDFPAFAAGPPPARAKAVIQIWLWGGACHLDTFDPKPEAGTIIAGVQNAHRTNVPGIKICECCLCWRTGGQVFPHPQHDSRQQCPRNRVVHGPDRPADRRRSPFHALARWCRCSRVTMPDTGIDPAYIVLTEPQGRFSEAGFLGSRYKPFATAAIRPKRHLQWRASSLRAFRAAAEGPARSCFKN